MTDDLTSLLREFLGSSDASSPFTKMPQLKSGLLALFRMSTFLRETKSLFESTGIKQVPAEKLTSLIQQGNFPTGISVALLFALTSSENSSLSKLSLEILVQKLLNLSPLEDFKDLPKHFTKVLLRFMLSSEVLKPHLGQSFLSAVGQFFPHKNLYSLAFLLERHGERSTQTSEAFDQAIRDVDFSNLDLVDDVAEAISFLVSPWGKNFNAEVVAAVSTPKFKSVDWQVVFRKLDQFASPIQSDDDFRRLVKTFSLFSSGKPIPASPLLTVWENKSLQVSILSNGLRTDILDFTGTFLDAKFPVEVKCPVSGSWQCPGLYSVLLDLDSAGFTKQVVEIFGFAAQQYLEYLIVGLAQMKNHPTRTEILRQTLPHFTGLPGSYPTSMLIINRLLTVNADVLVFLFRIGLKRADTVETVQLLENTIAQCGQTILSRIENEGAIDELIGVWCLKADVSEFDLDKKVSMALENNPLSVKSIVSFLLDRKDLLRSKSSQTGPILSNENFGVLIKVIVKFKTLLGSEEMEALSRISKDFSVDGNQSDLPFEASPVSSEIEAEANAYFQKIYTSETSIADAVNLLKKFKTSDKQKEQDIFRCMIHNLFDEYRFFHKYPEKELQVTGRLFGALVSHQLVSGITLGIALRYVLEALKKEPETNGSSEKMFRFGKIALEQFRGRFGEWPQYCSHLVQISHFARHCPELFVEVNNAVNAIGVVNQFHSIASSVDIEVVHSGNRGTSPYFLGDLSLKSAASVSPSATTELQQTLPESNEKVLKTYVSIIDKLVLVNTEIVSESVPSDAVRDQILFIVNNIAKDNFQTKIEELRHILIIDHYNWFANYLVVKRISTMPNLHHIYLSILDFLNSDDLYHVILDTTYYNATKLLQSPNITTSSSERSLLRNLGVWLGQITLAKNKPILNRRMNLKSLLIWGYETARLIAVCSFVAKIIESSKESRIFRPPNPWLMGILCLMRELYDIEDLKMNIKFEVQVLCKNINIRIEDIPRGSLLTHCKLPVKDGRNPDFTLKSSSSVNAIQGSPANAFSATTSQLSQGIPEEEKLSTTGDAAPGVAFQEQTVIPNLASYVTINQSLTFFAANPSQRKLVPLAIDRAIREIIQPVVERSVAIANTTTKHLILKDFSSEPSEIQLRNGAHLMISNLAGSLALVTCKEPLRISISNNLRLLLSQSNIDQATLEQIIQVCSNDNLELGRILIEKASTEKAIRDIDESISAAILARKKAKESSQPFLDTTNIQSKFFDELPEPLKPKMNGLSSAQYTVYESFQRQRVIPAQSQASPVQPEPGQAAGPMQSNTASFGLDSKTANVAASAQNINAFSMPQSLEAYQVIFARLDTALKAVQHQASGREVTISMLGSEHEILGHFRDMIIVTQRTLPTMRSETAMAFCEIVFKRLMESINTADSLRIEVMIGVIEALRDACGGIKKFVPDIVAWLSHYATFSPVDENSRKFHRIILLLLLRAKLIRAQEIDVYFATCMDSGRNIAWVEVAMLFIKQCLAEGLASTNDFSNSFDTVSKMRPANINVRKQLQKWLTDLRAITDPKAAAVREQVTALLERWLRVWNSSNEQMFSQYLQIMHQFGVLKTEDAADRFFRISTELCVEACLKTGQISSGQQPSEAAATLNFTVIDALSRLFILLVRLADKEAGDTTVRVNLLSRILGAVGRTIIDDHDSKKNAKTLFDQRPYYRLLSNLSQDLTVPDPKAEPNPVMIPLLTSYCQIYHALQPSVLPGFAYSWLQLISHRTFMPHLLLVKGQKCWPFMHRLIIALLLFLQPFLKHSQLNDSIRKLYKGTLRVLLVLLHDFPEFLCDFHLSFCDVIPPTCVQLRNLILSAFPRSMRLPDPFTPNLKVDLLPEISQPPRILTDYMAPLVERGIRQRIDSYMSSKQPLDLLPSLASVICAASPNGGVVYNLPLLTSITVYVGTQAVLQLHNKSPLQNSPSMDIFKFFASAFDAEGRYHLFNVMANQLRYPNSHTHYFSCVILWLFAEADNEFLQEQITRVLLERLIVHRPHPWGLLITFIELIKNSRYSFWKKSFVYSVPEIEKVFDVVARSCMGPAASSTIQQQQQQQQVTAMVPPTK